MPPLVAPDNQTPVPMVNDQVETVMGPSLCILIVDPTVPSSIAIPNTGILIPSARALYQEPFTCK